MKRKKAKKILEESYREYREDPREWSFWVSPRADPPEIYLIHGDIAYFLKVDSLFTPSPIGVGAKFEVEEGQLPENLPEYGFRQLSREELKRLFEDLPSPSEIRNENEFWNTIREARKRTGKKLVEKEPIPSPREEMGGAVFLGPHHRGTPLEYISDEQRKIREDLERELEKLKRREYPGYA